MPYCTRILVSLLGALALAGCGEKPAARAPVEAARELTVFYTCDTRGNVHACDCTGGSAGGISRRSTYLRNFAVGEHLLVDAGNVGAGTGARELLDLDALLEGYRRLGYDAVNAGRGEVVLGLDALRARAAITPALISANVLDEQGRLVLPSHVSRTLTNGLRVAITGVVEPALVERELGAGLRVKPPADALGSLLPELRRTHDAVLVLAFMEQSAMIDLATLFYEIDALIGGAVEQPTAEPVMVNRATLTAITDRGKSIGRLDLSFHHGRASVVTNDITMLYDAVPDDPALRDLLEAHAQKVTALTNAAAGVTFDDGLRALPGAAP